MTEGHQFIVVCDYTKNVLIYSVTGVLGRHSRV